MRQLILCYQKKNLPDAAVQEMMYSFGSLKEIPEKLNQWNMEQDDWHYWLKPIALPKPSTSKKSSNASTIVLGLEPSKLGVCTCHCEACTQGPHLPQAGCEDDCEWKPVYTPNAGQMEKLDWGMICINCNKDYGCHSGTGCNTYYGPKKGTGIYTVKELIPAKSPKLPKPDILALDDMLSAKEIPNPFNPVPSAFEKGTDAQLGFCKGIFCDHKKAHAKKVFTSVSCEKTWKSIEEILHEYQYGFTKWAKVKCADCGKIYGKHFGNGYCYLSNMLGYRPDAIFNPVPNGICSGALCGSKAHPKTSDCKDWTQKEWDTL